MKRHTIIVLLLFSFFTCSQLTAHVSYPHPNLEQIGAEIDAEVLLKPFSVPTHPDEETLWQGLTATGQERVKKYIDELIALGHEPTEAKRLAYDKAKQIKKKNNRFSELDAEDKLKIIIKLIRELTKKEKEKVKDVVQLFIDERRHFTTDEMLDYLYDFIQNL